MNTREHFESVVAPNYNAFLGRPDDFRLLENALHSVNTVAERLALERRDHVQLGRSALYGEAQKIHDAHNSLSDLHSCTNTLKHAPSIKDHRGEFTTIATSTGINPNDPTTWIIGDRDLAKVAHDAFATLKEIPELK